MIRLFFAIDDDASPAIYIGRGTIEEVRAVLDRIPEPRPVTPHRAAIAFIRATVDTGWDLELVSMPVTELAGLLDFVDDGSTTRNTIAFDPRLWKGYDLPALLMA